MTELYSIENEEAVVSSILINEDCYYDVAAILRPDDFYIQKIKWVWESFVHLKENGEPIDFQTVVSDLGRRGLIDEIGGPAYIAKLSATYVTSYNAEAYAREVRDYATRREMIAAAEEVARLAHDIERPADEALLKSHERLQSVQPGTKERTIKQIAQDVYNYVDKWSKTKELPGITSGLKDLDYLLGGGYQDTDLDVVAGRPGQGKTGFMLTGAIAADAKEKHVAVFSLEMADLQVGQRLIAQKEGIDLFRMRTGKLNDDEWPKLTAGFEWLGGSRIMIDETPAVSPAYIHAVCKKLQARGKLDIVFIDYLQLMIGEGQNIREQIGFCTSYLKRVAKDLGVPVVVGAQLNREIERRSNHRPNLADLQETGKIEQDADVVLFLWQKDATDEKPKAKLDLVNMTVGKHRNGATGDVSALMERTTTAFKNGVK